MNPAGSSKLVSSPSTTPLRVVDGRSCRSVKWSRSAPSTEAEITCCAPLSAIEPALHSPVRGAVPARATTTGGISTSPRSPVGKSWGQILRGRLSGRVRPRSSLRCCRGRPAWSAVQLVCSALPPPIRRRLADDCRRQAGLPGSPCRTKIDIPKLRGAQRGSPAFSVLAPDSLKPRALADRHVSSSPALGRSRPTAPLWTAR